MEGYKVIANTKVDGWILKCPACKSWHVIYTKESTDCAHIWSFNGDMKRPTFMPSVRLTWYEGESRNIHKECHFFVKNGFIQFCADSTHALAGKTVELENWE